MVDEDELSLEWSAAAAGSEKWESLVMRNPKRNLKKLGFHKGRVWVSLQSWAFKYLLYPIVQISAHS